MWKYELKIEKYALIEIKLVLLNILFLNLYILFCRY